MTGSQKVPEAAARLAAEAEVVEVEDPTTQVVAVALEAKAKTAARTSIATTATRRDTSSPSAGATNVISRLAPFQQVAVFPNHEVVVQAAARADSLENAADATNQDTRLPTAAPT